ncbi:MAG: long-chain fatty acid--CoA ligase [Archaeoglobales archaeon]|nr:long-chain fatty acid--CoA ligase [Archaeoglobales archaeon]
MILGVEGENLRELDPDKVNKIWLKFYDQGVREHIDYPVIPAYELLESTAKRNPNGNFVYFFGNYLTYQQAKEGSDKICGFLKSIGFEKGEKAIVSLPNTPHYTPIAFGIMKAGGVVVQCNPLYTTREIRFIAKNSGASVIFCLDLIYSNVEPLVSEGIFKKVVLCSIQDFIPGAFPVEPAESRKELATFADLMKADKAEKYAQVDPKEDVAMLQYTGGTTGTPKGVMLTHYNLVVNAYQAREWDPKASQSDVGIGLLPVFHVYGMTMLNAGILVGGMVIPVPDPRNYELALQLIQNFRVTTFTAVPTMFVGMMEVLERQKFDLSSLRVCTSGAAPLPLEVKERWERMTGVRIAEGYGLSEASPVTHCNPLYGLIKPGSIGVPYPDTLAVVVDEEGNVLPPRQVGELAVYGPQVMKGYWKMESETRNVLINGWLLTGDLAKFDEDGYFYIVDRKKDMIIAGGYNVYPREVEEVLYEHPAVLEAAVIGIPDPYRGETVKAFVQLKPEYMGKVREEDIISFCRERLAPYKVPKLVEFRDQLPKTLVGKILRRALREEENKSSES